MSCALTPAEVARSGIQTAFFTRLGPPRVRSRRQIHDWSLEFEQGALFWCSNRPAVLPGERHMGNVGLNLSWQGLRSGAWASELTAYFNR